MNDIWVCPDCKSINRQRDDVCYRCRAPQSGAMETPGLDVRAESAAVERAARTYLPSWPLALISAGLIVAVAILGVVLLRIQVAGYPALKQAFVDAVSGGAADPGTALVVDSVGAALLSALRLGLALVALVTFAGWLGLVTRNVPLLGGGTPSRSPLRVFAYALIPIWNLVKVPGIILDLLYRLDPREGGAFMVLAAWLGLVGSWFVSWIGSWAIAAAAVRSLPTSGADTPGLLHVFSTMLDQSFWLSVVVEIMIALGAILLAAIMVRVESRAAARDREIRLQMAATGAPVPPAGPAWGSGDARQIPAAATLGDPTSAAPVPGPAVAVSAPYEPHWPAGRAWPGGPSSTTTADLGGPEAASDAAAPTAAPTGGPTATLTVGPTAPPPPPPDAPRLG